MVRGGHGGSKRVKQGPPAPMRFNEVLVWFMDGLEIKKGSIKVMVFP